MNKKSFLTLALLLCTAIVFAVDQSYYTTINNTSGSTLRDNLCTITSAGPSNMSYDKLWTAYKTTDVYPTGHANAGKIWDMYSDCIFTAGGSGSGGQCGTYSNECDCYNREHSMPKSWFNESKPAYYDLGHIVPTDGKVNGIRSNYAFGEVGKSTKTFSHSASKFGTAKAVTTTNVKGTSTITTSYTGTVYEPDDQYKGDFARMYMYMRVRYKSMSITTGDGSLMFNSTDANYGMTDYSIALLMKWHRQDPVSQKEIDRNNGMQSVQGNRNPFIDYPALAEYLWGSKAGETFKFADVVASFDSNFEVGVSDGFNTTDPAISSPSGVINVGSTSANTPLAQTIKVQGRNLTDGNLTLGLSGTDASLFSLSTTSISKANAEAGQNITITYSPTANGTHTATLSISGCGVTSHTVTLNGTCETRYIVNWRSDEGLYNTNTAASNGKPTLPEDPDACDATRVFVGWTLQAGYNNTTTAPTDLFTESSGAINITKDTTFYAVYADADNNGGSASSQSYTFSSKSWTSSPSGWTSGKDGNGYSNSGVQVTTGASGANGTGPTSFSNVTSAVVSYCTNASSGVGSIEVSIGSTSISQDITKTGGTTARDLTFDFSGTTPTGAPKITVTCTTNSIYVCGITINYGSAATYSNYSTQCATGPTATITFHANGGSGTMEAQTVSQNKNTSLHTNEFTREGYTFAGWATSANGEVLFEDEETININSDLDLYAKWIALTHYTVTWHVDGKTKAVDYIEETVLNLDTVPQNCSEDRVFMGWTAHSGYSSEDTEPDDLFTSASGTVSANADYYAIFADKETSGSGSEESLSFSSLGKDNQASVDGENISIGANSSITFNKGSNTNTPKYFTSGSAIRLYGGGNCVVASSDANISQIVFTFASGEDSNTITANVGSYADGTWTGDASSVTFTVGGTSGNRRFASVAVTIGGGSTTTYSNYSTSCTSSCTPTDPVVSFASASLSKNCTETVNNAFNKGGSKGDVTYSSSNTNAATVDATTGEVSIVAAGTTTITANITAAGCYNAASTSYTLTVTRQATITTFNSTTSSLTVGESVTNTANTTSDQTVTYSSSNTSVATVNASGTVTAVAAGSVTITASVAQTGCLESSSASYNITVSNPIIYTVTWHVNGKTKAVDYVKGSALSLDTVPQNCSEDRVFMGWTSDGTYSNETTAPSDLFTSASGTVTANADYYAIFADKETSSGSSSTETAFSTTSLGSTNSVTTGYTVSATMTAKDGYYQDGSSGTCYVNIYNTNTPMFSSTPQSISVTVSIGAGSNNLSFSDYVYAQLVNASGETIGSEVEITNSVTASTGDSHTVSIPTTGITSANGVRIYHAKETGKNMRVYSVSLSYTTSGSTTTYSNYNTSCGATTKYTITWDAATNGGSCATATTKVTAGQAVGTLPEATKDHASFEGWFDAASGGTEITASTVPTGDITYYAQFTAEPTYTVTFMNGSEVHHTQTNYAGTTITLPGSNPSPCSGYSAFAGWASSEQVSETTINPVVATPTTIPAENKTYYAVFSRTENSGSGSGTSKSTYNKVTSTSDIENGDYLIVYEDGNVAFNGALTTLDAASNTISITLSASGDSITNFATVDAAKFTITASNGNIQAASGKYIGLASDANALTASDDALANTLSIDNGDFVCVGSGGAYLRYNPTSGQTRFRYFKSGTYTNQKAIQLYKKVTTGGGSSTTYYTTNCCSATITVQTSDTAKGTVSVE